MRTIAFYLPQFHQIPENDEWWGDGFTDWVNVKRAEPLFEGHEQPRLPGEFGEYDLTDPEIHSRQTALAQKFGVDGFCMYFYWFGGKRLLEKPVEAWRENPDLLPYCLSWANESWTRRWDGKSQHVLMGQEYGTGYIEALFADLLPHFQAPHYMTLGGEPILVIHRADHIPDPQEFSSTVQKLAADAGFPGIHLVAAETAAGIQPGPIGFSAVAEFPPVGANTLGVAELVPVRALKSNFRGRLMSYERLARRYMKRPAAAFTRYPGAVPGWDNTPRRREASTIYKDPSPQLFGEWAAHARAQEAAARGEMGLFFINAWNEWAEGAVLEPDKQNGPAYLEALSSTTGAATAPELARARKVVMWTFPQLRSLTLAAMGSVLSAARRVRRTWS